jgi:E3 ubiquitin-protein ligase DMA1/2
LKLQSPPETHAAPPHATHSLEGPNDGAVDTSSDEHPNDETQQDLAGEVERVMNRLRINDEDLLPEIDGPGNTSVAPIDISRPGRSTSRRQSTSVTAGRGSSHDILNGVERTPSPTSRILHSTEVSTGTDGPMTPRNDAGPFILDGSAGRGSISRMVSLSLAATAQPTSTDL